MPGPLLSPARVPLPARIVRAAGARVAVAGPGASLVLVVAVLTVAFGGREPLDGEAAEVYGTARALVARAELHLPFPAQPGPDGRPYARVPLLNALPHLPGVLVARAARGLWQGAGDAAHALGARIAPALAAGLLALVFFRLLLSLGLRTRSALWAALLHAVGTVVWVYGRAPLSTVFGVLAFLGSFAALVRLRMQAGMGERGSARAALALGGWLAVLCNLEWLFVLSAPVFLALGIVWLGPARRGRALSALLLPVALGGVLLCLDARLRTGAALAWLRLPFQVPLRQGWLMGLWGLGLSPGKNLLSYSPVLLLAPWGVSAMRARGLSWVLWAALAVSAPVCLYLARYPFWHGDPAWGPRHLAFATPLLFLPVAFALYRLRARAGALRAPMPVVARARALAPLAGAAALVLLSLGVQLLGGLVHWRHYFEIARTARAAWLGVPERGAAFAPLRDGGCHPCFEDAHTTVWLPPFQPIEGQLWLVRHLVRGHDGVTAEADAAWRKQTRLALPVEPAYAQARIDWWPLQFAGPRRLVGTLLLLPWAALLAVGLRGLRPGRASGDEQPERPDV